VNSTAVPNNPSGCGVFMLQTPIIHLLFENKRESFEISSDIPSETMGFFGAVQNHSGQK